MRGSTLRHAGLGLLLGAVVTACAAPYQVVQQSGPPSALRNLETTIVAFDYSRMIVEGMSLDAWMKKKTAEDAEYPKTWLDLQGRWEEAFRLGFSETGNTVEAGTLESQPTAGQCKLVVRVLTFTMGKYFVVSATATRMDTEMDFVVGPDVTDIIALQAAQQAGAFNPSVFQHVKPVGQALGRNAGKFFADSQNK
ncbi:MAG: hypothetical protein AAFU79_10730 [Myxococcota bacterium]